MDECRIIIFQLFYLFLKVKRLPIEANDDEIGDRGVAHGVVEGEPGVADPRSEGPPVEQQVHGVQGHGHGTDGEVGHCQAEQEVVGYRLQLGVNTERNQHQEVTTCQSIR